MDMSRRARVVAVGAPHHITQRGNNRQDVFLTDEDRLRYLQLLRQHAAARELRVLGYCLMTNHVHLVVVPERKDSMARTLRSAHSVYSFGFNKRYRRIGHLWQNRFFSCVLGGAHALRALAYVDLNPVRAGMVGDALEYPWSSARAHVTGEPDPLVDHELLRELRGFGDWADVLRQPLDPQDIDDLRAATHKGVVLGSKKFVRALEEKEGRPLGIRGKGRPPLKDDLGKRGMAASRG